MKFRSLNTVFALLFISLLFVRCGKKSSNEIVVYTSVDQVFTEPVLKNFELKTGIKVKPVFDTEETKSTGVLNRLIAEKDNPQCDVFWSGDPVRNIILKNKGITQKFIPQNGNTIASEFKDSSGYWIGFSSRARVLLYNTNLIKPDEAPSSIYDLINQKWRGKCAIANPLFGTTSFQIASLFAAFGDEKAKQFMSDLKKNNVIIATSNGDVKKRVCDGEIYFGLVDTDDSNEALKEGSPVKMVFLDQDNLGSLVIPNTLSLIKNSPNNENGKKFIEYLLTPEVEKKLAELCAQMPLLKSTGNISGITNVNNIRSMKVDYAMTAKKLEEIQDYLKEWVK